MHTSTKSTPIPASSEKNECYVYQNVLDKRKKNEPKFKNHDLFKTADSKKNFSKGDWTNWSYKIFENTEIIKDTIPSYRIDEIPERYNEALLKQKQSYL